MTSNQYVPFTIDAIIKGLNASLFDPLIQLTIPLYLSLGHLNIKLSTLTSITSLKNIYTSAVGVNWLEVVKNDLYLKTSLSLLSISLLIRFNNYLSSRSRNNGLIAKWDWNQEIVCITGGAGGIGMQTVLQLAKQGIRVAVIDSQPLTYDAPPTITYFKCDLTKPEEVKRIAEKIQKELGHPTVLINNAGILRGGSILNTSSRDIDLTYDVNVKAHYYTVQNFLPNMLEKKHGHIITMASSTAYIQAANAVSYCSSKAAALSFHEGLSLELRDVYNCPEIKTSIICPSHVKTNLFNGYTSAVPQWLMPSLEVAEVASEIVNVVKGGKSEFVILPAAGYLVIFSRIAPTYLWKLMMLAGKDSMQNVTGSKI